MAMIGQIYYKFIEDELHKFRITKYVKSSNKYHCKDDKGQVIKLSDEEIKQFDYTLLKPNGHLVISSVILEQNLHDVIIAFGKMDEMEKGDGLPYACCRQSVIDVYSNLTNNIEDFKYVGIAIDKDSCPQDVDYKMMFACDKIDKSEVVAYYIGDDIKGLLSWTKLSYYDSVLDYMYQIANKTKFKGYCNTVYDLMDQNQFIHNIYRAFDIKPVELEFSMTEDQDDLYDGNPLIPMVENIIKAHISSVQIMKYGYDIDFNQIKRSYLLIADLKGDIYVLIYDEGDYYNPGYAQIDDKRELETLNAILAMKSKS